MRLIELRSVRSFLLGLPVLGLVSLGLAVSLQVGCALVDSDEGLTEDFGVHGAYGRGGYGGYGP